MPAVNYRATIDGGAKISHGIITTIAVEILPTVRKGRRVYVRAVVDPSVCVEIRLTGEHLDMSATQWGLPIADLPDWANGLRNLLFI